MKKKLSIIALSSTLMGLGGFNLFSCATKGDSKNIEFTPVTKEKREMNPNVPNITVGDFRLQLLDESTFRLEYKYDNPIFHTYDWLDDDTLFVPNRTLYKGVKDYKVEEGVASTTVSFGDIKIVIPHNMTKSLLGVEVYQNGERIFTSTGVNPDNTGNLPAPEETPDAFALVDYPRIIEPPFGYSASNLYIEPYRSHLNYFKNTCGFEIQDHKDIYVMIPRGQDTAAKARSLRQLYRNLAGPSELVRLSTLGAWDSRYYPYNETTAQEEVDHYYENHLPLDNLVIDTDWRAGFDGKGYFINETLFPNMPRFLKSMHDQNIEVCFNDHPEPQKDDIGVELDVLNQKEVEFRRTNLKKIMDMGLDTWWYDRNWSTSLICPTGTTEDMLNHETWGDYLYNNVTRQTYMAKASKEYEEYGQYVYERPIAMSNVVQIRNGRWDGFTDSAAHRYSFQWTGDQTPAMLPSEITNVIKTGINSMPYMSSDLAGHTGGVASDYYYQRWIQYGALSPIFRIHCTRDLPIHCQPWLRGEEVTNVFRNWINLRYRLLPLYYSLARESYETGLPICRALGFNYNNVPEQYKENEYLIGNNILFAPCSQDVVVDKSFPGSWNGGFTGLYYKNQDFVGTSEEVTYPASQALNFDDMKAEAAQHLEGQTEHFSVRFTGTFTPSVTKELVLNADDGVRVTVVTPDGETLTASDWCGHSARDLRTGIVLKQGESYNITLDYFQKDEGGSLHMWSSQPEPEGGFEETKTVYLPEGQWYDVFHGRVYDGGTIQNITYPVDENAVFARIGSMTPIIDNAQNTKELDWTHLSYDVYPTDDISGDYGTLYEDDFRTVAYQDGFYHKSDYACYYDISTGEYVIRLEPAKGWYIGDDAIANRRYSIRLHQLPGLTIDTDSFTLDGRKYYPEEIPAVEEGIVMPFGFGENASNEDIVLVNLHADSVRLGHEIRFKFK